VIVVGTGSLNPTLIAPPVLVAVLPLKSPPVNFNEPFATAIAPPFNAEFDLKLELVTVKFPSE
jgi:hypothetical protein